MSFLAGRAAAKEGAFFFQESKQAVNRLVEKSTTTGDPKPPSSPPPPIEPNESIADVLPEVLRHSIPLKSSNQSSQSSPLYAASKWALRVDSSHAAATSSSHSLNPLRDQVALPQVTFGSRRWALPSQSSAVMASTANELRKDRYETQLSPEKLKAAAEGFSQVGKAFAAATVIVFGGGAVAFVLAASKFELRSSDDLRTKGKDLAGPRFEMIREKLIPVKTWVEDASKKSKKWHFDKDEDMNKKFLSKELSKMFGPKASR